MLFSSLFMRSIIACMFFLLFTLIPLGFNAQTLESGKKIMTGYAMIFYEDDETLRLFNKKIKLGSMSYILKRKVETDLSVEGQISGKVNVVIAKVEEILEMYPKNFKVDIHIVRDIVKVRAIYERQYGRKVKFWAFYSPIGMVIYVAADEIELKILAHELAHAVIDQFFGVVAPEKIHEILAHYVDENFKE